MPLEDASPFTFFIKGSNWFKRLFPTLDGKDVGGETFVLNPFY
jgi:hypothetical protein